MMVYVFGLKTTETVYVKEVIPGVKLILILDQDSEFVH